MCAFITASLAGSLQAMDLRSSAELIKSLVEGDLVVENDTIAAPGSPQSYTLAQFHEGLKDHGFNIDEEGNMYLIEEKKTPYAENLVKFFTMEDIAHADAQGIPLNPSLVNEVEANRDQLLEGLIFKDSQAMKAALQNVLTLTPESLGNFYHE